MLPDVPWISLLSPSVITSMQPGDTRIVSLALDPLSDSGTLGDLMTILPTPAFKGTTEAQADVTVEITGPNGYHHTGCATANALGAWSYTVPEGAPMDDGQYTIAARAVDTEGNHLLADGTLTLGIDRTAPVSIITDQPANVSPYFLVRWSATDNRSGAKNWDVYVSEDGGPFTLWLAATTLTSARRSGLLDHLYSFYCVARDHAGNIEQKTPIAEWTATITRQFPFAGDSTLDCQINILDLIFIGIGGEDVILGELRLDEAGCRRSCPRKGRRYPTPGPAAPRARRSRRSRA